MIKRFIFILLAGFTFSVSAMTIPILSVKAESVPDLIGKATEQYNKNFYDDSIRTYSKIISEKKIVDWRVLYNLGNCYYKKKNLPYAMWNYYLSYKLNPNDGNLKSNIAIVKSYLIDKEDFSVLSHWYLDEYFFSKITLNHLGEITAAIIILLLLFLIINNLTLKKFLKVGYMKVSFIFVIILLIISITLTVWKTYYFYNMRYGVVLDDKILVLDKPSNKTGEGVFVINKGSRVRLLQNIKDWYLISLPNGLQGWMRGKDFIEISFKEMSRFYQRNDL